jgi:hypothetical protein
VSVRTFLKALPSTFAPRRPTRRNPPAWRPRVEPLEDRWVPGFGPAVNYDVGSGPRSVDVGDFNGDGIADVVSAAEAGVAVLTNNGDGTLAGPALYPLGQLPLAVRVGDLNGDGKLDLAAATTTSDVVGYGYDEYGNLVPVYASVGHVRVLLGNGTGSFTASAATYDLGGGRAMQIALGDLDGDRDLDLVVSNLDGDAGVLLGNGDGTFAARQGVVVGDGTRDVDLADLNRDGVLDLVAGSAFNNTVYLLLGTGGGFRPPQTIASFTPVENSPSVGAVAVGDINGDGNRDLAVTYTLWYGGEYYGEAYGPFTVGYVQALLGNGDGTFAAGNSHLLGDGYVADVEFADFSGDGRLDVVTGGYGAGNVSLLRGNGDGTFNAPEPSAAGQAGGGPNDLAVADLDRDGAPDVVTANFGSNTISALLTGVGPLPGLRVGDVTVAEGNAGTRTATFTVILSAASGRPVTVAYATADGTATAGGDYRATSGTLTFAPGETRKTVTILVNGDRLPEPSETFAVNLSGPTNAAVADGQGVGTVTDDEPRISIGDVTRSEGRKNQTTKLTFTVTLSAAYDQAVTMSFRTVNGSATTGDGDYVGKTGTLTFAPGETTKTVTIEVKGDGKREVDEYFYLDLFGNSSNSLLERNRGTGTILNDD